MLLQKNQGLQSATRIPLVETTALFGINQATEVEEQVSVAKFAMLYVGTIVVSNLFTLRSRPLYKQRSNTYTDLIFTKISENFRTEKL